MNVDGATEKLQRIAREKEAQKIEHKQRQEEEVELLKKIEVDEQLRRVEKGGVLNIQSLAMRLPPHSSSSSKCVERKAYNEKIQFVQTIIQDIDTTGTSIVEFLCRSRRHWWAKEQIGPGITSKDLMFIEESKEDKVVE